MNDMLFERRTREWLDAGPSTAPAETVAAILSALETAPQRPALPQPLRAIDSLGRRDGLDVGIDELTGRGRRRPLAVLAAAALLAVALIGALLAGQQREEPPPAPLPDILAGFPQAIVVFEQQHGTPGVALSGDASRAEAEIGRVTLERSYVMGAVCSGPGAANLRMRPSNDDPSVDPGAAIEVPCTGAPVVDEVAVFAGVEPVEYRITLGIAEGASWRVLVGEYPETLGSVPAFTTLAASPGWTQIIDMKPSFPTLRTQPSGVAVHTPEDATRLGVLVDCRESGTVEIGLHLGLDDAPVAGRDAASRVACPTSVPQRVELPVTGGQDVFVRAHADSPVWVRLLVEANADAGQTLPSAPPMPSEVAATGYSSGIGGFVLFGTLGSSRELRLPYPDGTPSPASGDYVPVTQRDPATGESRFDLISISRGEVATTIVTERLPRIIVNGWVSARHEQAIWITQDDDGFHWYVAGLDGTGAREVATLPRTFSQLGLQHAVDESVFVVQWCDPEGCHRVVVDGPTGDVSRVELADARACSLLGALDGLVVERLADACDSNASGDSSIAVSPLLGGPRRVISEASPAGSQVVSSDTGPQLVYVGGPDFDHPTIEALDLATGEVRVLLESVELGAYPQPLHLPAGWVLIANQLGQSPAFPAQNEGPPLLLNVDTGERIELVNLPHRAGVS